MTAGGVVELDEATLELDASGIVIITHRPNAVLDDVGSRRMIEAHRALVRGERRPVLVDARGVRGMSRQAREASSGPEVAELSTRVAVVVDSQVSSVIGNFFLRVSRPPYPTRLFTRVAEARAWLLDAKESEA